MLSSLQNHPQAANYQLENYCEMWLSSHAKHRGKKVLFFFTMKNFPRDQKVFVLFQSRTRKRGKNCFNLEPL